jgi:hypothetical protein
LNPKLVTPEKLKEIWELANARKKDFTPEQEIEE